MLAIPSKVKEVIKNDSFISNVSSHRTYSCTYPYYVPRLIQSKTKASVHNAQRIFTETYLHRRNYTEADEAAASSVFSNLFFSLF